MKNNYQLGYNILHLMVEMLVSLLSVRKFMTSAPSLMQPANIVSSSTATSTVTPRIGDFDLAGMVKVHSHHILLVDFLIFRLGLDCLYSQRLLSFVLFSW